MTPPEPRRLRVGVSPPYSLYIGSGSIRSLPAWLKRRRLAERYALVTDSAVAGLHSRPLLDALAASGIRTDAFVFEAGESHKTRATKEKIEDGMLAAGLGRDAAVIALGGGVVSDLAGFVAATYLRGIPSVLIPTTLLAMVDASIGGKTGVDSPHGKNLIGAFHHPSEVFMDTDYLATLPDRQIRSGLAEAIKAGVIRDAGLFEMIRSQMPRLLARDVHVMTEAIWRACSVKAEVVAADEKEGDLRKILNFGHTIGHALEMLSGYTLPHGEAISIGMVAEARMAVKAGLLAPEAAAAIEATLEAAGLPARLPAATPRGWKGISPEEILEAARADKKARQGRIAYALPSGLGTMATTDAGFGILLDDAIAADVLAGMRETAPAG